jgi:hypothetical protein
MKKTVSVAYFKTVIIFHGTEELSKYLATGTGTSYIKSRSDNLL